MDITRRQFVTSFGLGIGGLAGCTAISDHQADIQIYNKTTTEVNAAIDVEKLSDKKQLLQDSFTLPPGGPDNLSDEQTYTEVVGGSTARVHLTVHNGPEGTHEFTDEEKTDAKGLIIDILSDSIEFSEVVR